MQNIIFKKIGTRIAEVTKKASSERVSRLPSRVLDNKPELISREASDACRACILIKKRKTEAIWKNQEIIDAFCNLKYTEPDGYESILGNTCGLRATILGKKPATYFDDCYNSDAIKVLLKNSKEIQKQTNGQIVILPTTSRYGGSNDPILMLFNTTKIKETIAKNFEFYKYHFPECKSVDDVARSLLESVEKGKLEQHDSIKGVTLGFPLGDVLLFTANNEKYSKKTLLSLLNNQEWTNHRKIIEENSPRDFHKLRQTGGFGFVTWNPETESVKDFNKLMKEDSNIRFNEDRSVIDLLKEKYGNLE